MPTRLIRDGILESSKVDKLGWQAEVFYRRLLSRVDDHGLYDARPSVLRASLFPLKINSVSESDVIRCLAACSDAELIELYEVDGKDYLKVLNTGWNLRSKPKYPVPPENNCLQLKTVVPPKSISPITNTSTSTNTRTTVFRSPTLEEVTAYCRDRKNGIDPQLFIDHYTANGWKIGKAPMKDWQASVRTWEKNPTNGHKKSDPDAGGI